ncbi:phage antirepressor N-terminal domain-containing protein [Avibacterium sp. 20-15]|uniref:phage antirepressor N-terminal domain-containing protein n=1 Tax=unclassified Avibacterium TaxID=2685287 RepID=UPI0020270EE0|nr:MULTISPECIES: phage antirepressor N-terminal domain-containing protein [unclassified Avibacterium]MCW9731905.1 phage antirepressor N-terminal domain-containing protein [Avibacterium sp. 20-15]URL04094.1 phage antirepressor N-terminal domain-containing protein [Avibacterium sp. 20-132]
MEALTAEFLGKEITLVDNNGIAYVAMREIVEGIGLEWSRQHKKLVNQSQKFNCVHMTTVAQDGKNREMLCMPIKKLNGWLFSINPNKVRADLKTRLEEYQEECFLALWDYWTEGIARRDEVKRKLLDWKEKESLSKSKGSEAGRLLNQRKQEKHRLELELAQIKQLDLFAAL